MTSNNLKYNLKSAHKNLKLNNLRYNIRLVE